MGAGLASLMQYLGAGVVVSPFALPESPISIVSEGRSSLCSGIPGGYTALLLMLRPILGKFLDFRLTHKEMACLLADRTSCFRG